MSFPTQVPASARKNSGGNLGPKLENLDSRSLGLKSDTCRQPARE